MCIAGTPCDNFRGFCDVFHKCRSADSDGPLARLKNFLLSEDKVKDWFTVSDSPCVQFHAVCTSIYLDVFPCDQCNVHIEHKTNDTPMIINEK